MEKEMLLAAVNAEQESFQKDNPDWRQPIHLDMVNLMIIIGALQLALRHPQFKRTPSAKRIREIVDQIIEHIPPELDATKKLMRLGDNPNYDI